MKIFNDIATGTLCGTIGFFSGKMPEIPIYSQIVTSMACALVSNGILYCNPYFKPEEHKVIGTLTGVISALAIGWGLDYVLSLPSYVTHPALLCSSFLISIVAASCDNAAQLNINEIRSLVRIAADLTHPESRLRRIALEPV